MAKRKQGFKLQITVPFEDIYSILAKYRLPFSVENVDAVCDYLETTANDAIRAALIDWKPKDGD